MDNGAIANIMDLVSILQNCLFDLFVKGRETLADGSYYEGNYVKGQKTGNGFFKFEDGSTYEGDWRYNAMEGIGKIWLFYMVEWV